MQGSLPQQQCNIGAAPQTSHVASATNREAHRIHVMLPTCILARGCDQSSCSHGTCANKHICGHFDDLLATYGSRDAEAAGGMVGHVHGQRFVEGVICLWMACCKAGACKQVGTRQLLRVNLCGKRSKTACIRVSCAWILQFKYNRSCICFINTSTRHLRTHTHI